MTKKAQEDFMRRALELAARARGRTSPNPMVGAVIVRDDRIIAEGHHRRAGEDHAEVDAIRAAGEAARGSDLYVNLEPCSHHGRTPPCTEAVGNAGIARVFAAIEDPNPLVDGRGGERLKRSGVDVSFGLLAAEARKLNEVYLKYIQTGRPFVILKSAVSLDGKIATRTGDSRWVSGAESRARVHEMRDAVDAVLVGIGTVLADDPMLTTRLPGRVGKNPARVIVDPFLKMPRASRMLREKKGGRILVAASLGAPQGRITGLQELGVEVLLYGGDDSRIDMRELMKTLGDTGVTSVLIEGGGEVAAASLAAGIVDKVVYFVAPKIVGGREAPSAVGGQGAGLMKDAYCLNDVSYTSSGADMMVEGYLAGGEN